MEPLILGWLATFLFSLALATQIAKTLRTKVTSGVSAYLFVLNLVANVIALVYATLIGQPPLQIKYILGILVSGVGLVVYWRYRD